MKWEVKPTNELNQLSKDLLEQFLREDGLRIRTTADEVQQNTEEITLPKRNDYNTNLMGKRLRDYNCIKKGEF